MASVQVSRQTLVEYQEVFSFFSQEARTEKEDAKITTEEFTTIVRSLGFAPTAKELQSYCAVIDDTYGGFLSFDNFTIVMVTLVVPQQSAKPDPSPAIRKAFKHFGEVCREGDNGTVSMKDLEHLMTQRGERLNEAEFRHMQRASKPTYGKVQYERLLQALSSEAATAGVPASAGSPQARPGRGGASGTLG